MWYNLNGWQGCGYYCPVIPLQSLIGYIYIVVAFLFYFHFIKCNLGCLKPPPVWRGVNGDTKFMASNISGGTIYNWMASTVNDITNYTWHYWVKYEYTYQTFLYILVSIKYFGLAQLEENILIDCWVVFV